MSEKTFDEILDMRPRVGAAKARSTDLVDWFEAQGITTAEACDVCAFLIGYINESDEPDVDDIVAMIAAGFVEAKDDKLKAAFIDMLPEEDQL